MCRGYGGFGALGHSVYHRELLPRLVEGSWNGRICHIATSGTHTAAITEAGKQATVAKFCALILRICICVLSFEAGICVLVPNV